MTATHVSARIYRYDPSVDAAPRYDTIEVPLEPRMRVLDVLEYAVDHCGIGLGFRHFCGVKRCGMCGVNVNGKPTLACWEEATPSMVIEPLGNMPVIRDLTVDRGAFERATVELEPRLVRKAAYAGFPEPLTHADLQPSFPLMNCIECYVCSSACPAVAATPGDDASGHAFVGPGSLVQLAKVALHPKDELDRSALVEKAGIENCMTCYRCEEVCPVGIPVVSGAIMPLRAIALDGPNGQASFPRDFAENVRANVDVHSASLFLKTRGFLRAIASVPLAWRMFVRRKTRLFATASDSAKRSIRALFEAAGETGSRR
ncbi:MAG TPA: 2Fe-2S iron-sulfur cluster-binding protein [Burkholderiales bacterium]|nr:2Fe-2S iron-sulfur cluster-binding protein [Burkholderiales bacterium]